MNGSRDEATRLGAKLNYNTTVKTIDHAKASVTLADSRVVQGKIVVVTCGATTDQFYQVPDQFKMKKQTIHCYYLQENKDLPNAFLLEGLKETNGVMVFGTVDGEGFTQYKVGNECEDLDPHLQLRVMQTIMPSKVERITHIMPCFYSMSHDDEFIFERHGKTVYGFGCNGRGFKHMTYHGKRIYNLI